MASHIELYIRMQWWPNDPNEFEAEVSRAGKAIFNKNAIRIIGTTWYRPERSGSTKPVPIKVEQLRKGLGWTREKLIEEQYMHRLVLANGLGEAAQAGVSGTVFEGSPNPNQFVVSLPEPQILHADGVEFQDVLSMAEGYARALHGVAVVSSSDLYARAREYGLRTDDKAAYAAFWGTKDVRANLLYKGLEERGIDVPYSRVACTLWRDLSAPNARAIEAVQELLV